MPLSCTGCMVLSLTTSPRRWRAVLSVQDLTTATPFCAAHPRQLSTNSSAFRTTLLGSSANVEDAPTPACCPLASSEAAGHVQGRTDDLQGAPHSNAGVSQRSVASHAPARSLRSSEAPTMVVPRTNTDLARRAFSVAAPSIWNTLPSAITV